MIVIVDYKMGNLGSISNIIKKVGHSSIISSDIEIIKSAKKLILPGVGSFDRAMHNLKDLQLIDILNEKALVEKVPLLGICLGMQLLTRRSEEGMAEGLGWIEADTKKFKFDGDYENFKIPHMGWNSVVFSTDHILFNKMPVESRFYFVHSYHPVCDKKENILLQSTYGYEFTCGIVKNNILGVQFHPEKSHKFGAQLMKNFIEKC